MYWGPNQLLRQAGYDLDGRFVWDGDTPVAIIRGPASNPLIYSIETDHLGTPRQVRDWANKTLRWQWDPDAFGSAPPNENPSGLGTFTMNLRFPGQYFDKETNLHYNYFRDYDPAIGRYVQSDPIGLRGGINTYAYVGNNPLSRSDPFGLQQFPIPTTGQSGVQQAGVLAMGARVTPPAPPTPQQTCYLTCRILLQPTCSVFGGGLFASFSAVGTLILGGVIGGTAYAGCTFAVMDQICEQECKKRNAPAACPPSALPPVNPAASMDPIVDLTFR